MVFGKGAVGQSRAGGAGAPLLQGGLGGLDAALVVGQAQIIIGAGKNDLLALDHALGGGQQFLGNRPKRLDVLAGQFRLEVGHLLEFVE